ncbi:hypothetical protein [Neorhodopirellula lusitana]|nr:hypothetical protein [Neorhodopirellula lusitana]
MNQTEPNHNQRDSQHHWMSKSRNAACFGRGVRWYLASTGTIDWSVAISLPLGLMTVLLLVLLPLITGGNADLISEITNTNPIDAEAPLSALFQLRWPFQLVLVWCAGLLFQVGLAHWWLSRTRTPDVDQPHDIVTLTIGGVWMIFPQEVESAGEISSNSFRDAATSARSHTDYDALKAHLTHRWPTFTGANRTVVLWSLVLISLGLMTLLCLTISSWGDGEQGTLRLDRPWIAACWMLCLQGVWQFLPLPQSLGRVAWSIMAGWWIQQSEESRLRDRSELDETDFRLEAIRSTRCVRWAMVGTAFATLITGITAIQALGLTDELGVRPTPLIAGIVLLSVWLFASSRNADLFAIQYALAENSELGRLADRWSVKQFWGTFQKRRLQRAQDERLRAAVAKERAEAVDASKVDEILQRMHDDGPESLSNEERDLLKRVSEAIRQERERGGGGSHDRYNR